MVGADVDRERATCARSEAPACPSRCTPRIPSTVVSVCIRPICPLASPRVRSCAHSLLFSIFGIRVCVITALVYQLLSHRSLLPLPPSSPSSRDLLYFLLHTALVADHGPHERTLHKDRTAPGPGRRAGSGVRGPGSGVVRGHVPFYTIYPRGVRFICICHILATPTATITDYCNTPVTPRSLT